MALGQIARALATVSFIVFAGVGHNANAQNWDGSGLVRFGVFLQGASNDFAITQMPVAGTPLRQSANPDGFGVGIAAGYDLRLGQFIIGGEIDAAWDDGRAKPGPNIGFNEQYGTDFFASARARLGVILHENWLLYMTTGYGWQGVEHKLNGFAGIGGTVAGTGNKKNATLEGWVIGGGLEYDASWGIIFGEYLYADYGTWSFRSFNNNNFISVDADSHIFRLGLKFKVGHDHSHDVYRRYDGRTLK